MSIDVALAVTVAAAAAWAGLFGYLAVVRDLAGGSHAEDLGFTEQVLFNFTRGQWFRMSIYDGATWNTELDLSHLARPDSLLAFHVEPMLLGLVPLFAVGGASALLVLQAAAVAAGAIPAYRIGRHLSHSAMCGIAVAAVYLLSPLGQWAVLSDFHSSTLAAPLLLLSLERLLVARAPAQSLAAALLALSAREDVGPVVALLGIWLVIRRDTRPVGTAFLAVGIAWTVAALLVIRAYSGDASPFQVRYGPTLADPPGALSRPAVLGYVATLLLSGGWLGLFAPLALLPTLPGLALNVLSTSPWMAAGKAHYSGLVLPFLAIGAGFGLSRLGAWPRLRTFVVGVLVTGSLASYALAGAGPLAANYAPARLTEHSSIASEVAASLPADAAVSASSSLVPRISQRARVYVFPAVLDAEYVFVDAHASPAPTSARDVFLRIQALLANGWRLEREVDGVVLLRRATEPPPLLTSGTTSIDQHSAAGVPHLVSAALVPSSEAAVDVDGPRWILRTTWQTDGPLPPGSRPEFEVDLTDGEQLHIWDIADVWWNPPDQWPVGQTVTIDVPDIPVRSFRSWTAAWTAQ